ncbi:hypothetical protein [Metamycoplasma buccale]|uniref:hypothetical protein n=1 Tax=Metamycoplasma buccale TaxID=55602 RepID=UPI00398ED44B
MKIKNLLVKISLTTLPFSPLITLSCQNKNPYLEMLLPFSVNDDRYAILNEIVNIYNHEILKNDPKKLPVSISSYSNKKFFYSHIDTALNYKDPKVSDLVFYYPSLAHLIARYNRIIDFQNEIKNSDIMPQFLEINKHLGIPENANKKNAKYIIPVSRSTDNLIINKLVFGYLIKKFIEFSKNNNLNKTIISSNKDETKIINEILSYYNETSDDKKSLINHIWNIQNHSINKEEFKNSNFNFTDKIFKNYYDLEKVSSTISKIINNKENKESKKILYSEHSANFMFSLLFNKANGDYSSKDYFLKYCEDKPYKLNYKNLYKLNSNEYNSFKEIYNSLYKLLEERTLHFKDPNKTFTDFNKSLFMLASTRAYTKITNDKKDFLFLQAPLKNAPTQQTSTFILQGLSLMGIHHTDFRTNQVKEFVKWLYSPLNKRNWNKNNEQNKMLENLTPIEYFSYKTNYLFPSNNFIKKYKENELGNNPANDAFINTLENTIKNPLYKTYEELVDSQSDSFRKTIDLLLQTTISKKTKTDNYDFEWFLNKIKEITEIKE